ncbi:MAG: carbohydrate binding domain-containing protein, partial [Anaerolineae bacterium]
MTETVSLTETASLTETTPLEETTPVTPTDDLPPTDEGAEPAPPVTAPTFSTFDSPLPTPPAPETEGTDWTKRRPQPSVQTMALSPVGGRLATRDNVVTFDFPPQAVDAPIDLEVKVLVPENPYQENGSFRWLTVDVEPLDKTRLVKGHLRLAQPVMMTIDLTGFPVWLEPFLVHRTNDKSETLPSQYDPNTQQLTAQVPGFSDVTVYGDSKFPKDGTRYLLTNLADVSPFSGAATYSYALDVPAGRNGMQPQLSLTYNSARLNAVMGVVQSSEVGSGWGLDGLVEIIRPITSRKHCWTECSIWGCGEQCESEIRWGYGGTFQLLIGGAAHYLSGPEPLANYGGCRYYAEDAPQLLVMRYTPPGTSQNPYCGYGTQAAPSNATQEFWVVTVPNGTTYRLGSTTNSEQVVTMPNYSPNKCTLTGCEWDYWNSHAGYAGAAAGKVASRWSVDQVRDVYGNTMTFGYDNEHSQGTAWDRTQLLDWIRYTGDAQSAGAYLVDIVLENRVNAQGQNHDDGLRGEQLLIDRRPWAMWDEKRVGRIRVCVNQPGNSCPDSAASLFEYQLGYQFSIEPWPGLEWLLNTINHETTRLASITKYGWNAQGQKVALPATTFTYSSYNQADNNVDPADGGFFGGKLQYPRLATVNNGYGGQVTLTYNLTGYRGVYSWRVAQKDTSDGLGRTARTTYTYTEPCFSGHDSWPNCRRNGLEEPSYALIGHQATAVAVYDYDNTLLSMTRYAFITEANVNRGKTVQTQMYNSGSQLLRQQDTLWAIRGFGPTGLGVTKGYVGQTLVTDYTSTPTATQRTDYTYDAADNLLAEYQYGAEERVLNGGFEAGQTGWTYYGEPTLPASVVEAVGFAGYRSLKLESASTSGGAFQDVEGLESGQTYTVRVWVKGVNTSTARFRLWLHDTTGANAITTDMTPGNDWQPVTLNYTANATGKVRVHLHLLAGTGKVYVDAVSVSRAADVGDERTIRRWYYNITDQIAQGRWFIGLKWAENVYQSLTANETTIKAQTIWYYDDTNYNVNNVPVEGYTPLPITQGKLTMVGQGKWTERATPGRFILTKYAYDAWGNVTSETDPNGNVTTTTYETTYRQFPTAVCRNTGTQDLCTYTRYYGVNEEVRSDDFGLFGQVQKTYDSNGEAATAAYSVYDAFGRLVKEIRPGDSFTYPTVEYAYTDAYASGGLQGLRVIVSQRETSGSAANLPVVTFYDGLGRAVQQRTEYQEAATQSVVNTVYDAVGHAVTTYVPEAESFTWEFSRPSGWNMRPRTQTVYDALGQVVRTIAPDGTQTSAISGGRVLIAEDANRHIKLSHNDAFGQLSQVDEALIDWNDTFSDGQLTGWGYGGTVGESGGTMNITGNGTWGNYINKALSGGVNVAQGVSFDVKYDPGTTTSTLYLSTGTWDQTDYRRWGVTFQNGQIYADRYIGVSTNRVATLLFPFQTNVWYRVVLKIGRDGQLIAAVWERDNPAMRTVTKIMLTEFANRDWKFFAHVHTGIGRLDNYDELMFSRTTYAYDTLGNLTTVTDTLGNVTTMVYDRLSRKTDMYDPDMGHWAYTYDNAGNLQIQTDARGCVTTFTYDPLNRLTGKSYGGACSGTAVTYAYDAYSSGTNYGRGYRTGMTDGSGSTTWTYDTRGRVTQETKTISGQSFTTQYTYDSMDRVVTMTYPDGEVVRNTYNAAGQPATLRSDTYGNYNYVSSASYNALGQITEMSMGNGTLTRWGYRGLGGNWDTPPTAGLTGYGRLYRIRTTAPSGEPWLDLRYGYDAVGNVTRIVDTPRQAANWPTSGYTFQDTFDSKNTTNWTWSTHQTVPYSDGGNNVVRNVGTGSSYDASFYRNAYSLVNGKGLQLRFKVSQTDTLAHFAIEANDSTYRRFGVIADGGKLYVQYRADGATWRYPADILTNLQVNTWYVLRIVVDDSGRGFYVEAYQENSPTVRGSYNITMPTGKTWRFRHWIYRGTAYIDDYREFNTSGLSWTPDERMGFTYDSLDRLVGASPVNGGQGYNQTYSYNAIGNLMTRDAFVYTYNAPTPDSGCSAGTPITKPHAVQTVSSLGSFTYDCNGNMLTRVENGVSYTQGWDQENR